MARFLTVGLVVVVAVALIVAPVAHAQTLTQGNPDFRIVGPEFGVHPGQSVDLTFHLQNDAEIRMSGASPTTLERVTTARGVRVTVSEGTAPVTVQSGTIPLGSVPEGQTPVTVRIAVDEDAEPGTYRLPVEVRYSYTNLISETSGIHQELTRTRTIQLPIEIEEGSRFRIVDTSSDLRIGERGTIGLEMENVGEHDARDATVHVTSQSVDLAFNDAAESVTAVGSWDIGETVTIPVDAQVARAASVRGLGLTAFVQYRDPNGAMTESPLLRTAITPRPAPSFELVDLQSAAQVGTTGPIEVVLRNTGDETVHDASVGADVTSELMRLDGSVSSETHVGDWEPGEERTAVFDLDLAEGMSQRSVGLGIDVRYDSGDGERIRSDRLTASVTPAPAQTFAFRDIESTLRVDASGRVSGTVENTGTLPVQDLSLGITPEHPSIGPLAGPTFIGTLEPGDTAEFSIRGLVAEGTDPGMHRIDLDARYRTVGDRFHDSTHSMTVDVRDIRDPIAIRAPAERFDAGYSGELTLNVTNQLDDDITDVELRLTVEDPLDSDYRTVIVPTLPAGAQENATFDLEIDSDAPASQYPATVEITYTDADGERITTRPATVAIGVTGTETGLFAFEIVIFVILAALVAAVFLWLYRR